MKRIAILMAVWLVGGGLAWGDEPLWVQEYKQGIALTGCAECYYGVGMSEESQEVADAKARHEFALMVETKISSVFAEVIRERNRQLDQKTQLNIEQISNISLRGIAVTERHQETIRRKVGRKREEQVVYYSLIRLSRDEYEKQFSEELQREYQRRQIEAAQLIKTLQLRAETEQARLRQDSLQAEQERQKQRLALEKQQTRSEFKERRFFQKIESIKRRAEQLYQAEVVYRSFLNQPPPYRVLSLRNGEIIPRRQMVSVSNSIKPFYFENLSYAVRIWLIETGFETELVHNKIDQQAFYMKLQLLPNTGRLFKTSLAFGVQEYASGLRKLRKLEQMKGHYSLFLSGNVSLPTLQYSYGSFYGDARRIALGVNNYALFQHFGHRLSFLAQLDFCIDRSAGNRFGDPVMLQAGIRFQATPAAAFTFAYEENEYLTLSIDACFGPELKAGW